MRLSIPVCSNVSLTGLRGKTEPSLWEAVTLAYLPSAQIKSLFQTLLKPPSHGAVTCCIHSFGLGQKAISHTLNVLSNKTTTIEACLSRRRGGLAWSCTWEPVSTQDQGRQQEHTNTLQRYSVLPALVATRMRYKRVSHFSSAYFLLTLLLFLCYVCATCFNDKCGSVAILKDRQIWT